LKYLIREHFEKFSSRDNDYVSKPVEIDSSSFELLWKAVCYSSRYVKLKQNVWTYLCKTDDFAFLEIKKVYK
jgi:hypothetical protein